MSAKIKANENYMDDVFSSIYSNLIQGIKRKEEMSIWGPVEMPVKGKNDFIKIIKSELLKEESTASDVNNSLLSPNKKVIQHDSIKNYSSKISQLKNVWDKENSKMTKREVDIGTNDSDEDIKSTPITCLRFHHIQSNKNDITPEAQNSETVKISDEYYQNTGNKSSFENNSSHNRHFSDAQYDNGENFSVIQKRFVESKNSKLEAVSNKYKSTSNILKNDIPVKSNKELPHDVNKKTHVKTEFVNWCVNRNKEYRSRSTLNLSDSPTPAAVKTEIQCFTNKKHSVRKNKSKERGTLVNIPFWKSEAYLNTDNCKIDGMDLSKTNLVDKSNEWHMEKSTSDFQLSSNLNTVMLKQESHDVTVNQKKPKMTVSVKGSDKNGLKVQHHNNYPKIEVAEDVLNSNESTCIGKSFKQKESSKLDEFVPEANRRSELKKNYIRKRACSANYQSYEPPPTFRDNGNEKSNMEPKVQSALKNANLKIKLTNERDKFSKKNTNQKKESSTISDSSEYINSRKNHCFPAKEKTQLCIRITNEKCDKDFEFMVDSFSISKIRKTLPQLSADIPDINSGHKEINYSADAMNILLRFVFCRSFKFVVPQVATGVEVLAAAQSWNITEFVNFYQERFLNVLTPTNACLIFSHAYHYDLKEICEACKSILPDNAILNTVTPRKRQKMCLISISTFVEPLEISIPFEPIEKNISSSFKKQIDNTFTFTAISGCYCITGLQVQLNEKCLVQKEENENMLEIDYSIKNVNGDQVIEGRERKPLRSINIIYFKKDLVLKPKEVGEIFIQTEIEPYLCSTHKEKNTTIKNSAGELELMMKSNWKVQNPNGKLFLVGKFFYHVRNS